MEIILSVITKIKGPPLIFVPLEDPTDETRLSIKIDSAMGVVHLKVKMTPDYPHALPELSVSGASHRLVAQDAIKALEKEVKSKKENTLESCSCRHKD